MSYKQAECLLWPIPSTAFESLPKKTSLHKIRVNTLKMLSATIAYLGPAEIILLFWGKEGTHIVNFR